MAYSYTWPGTLPNAVRLDFAQSSGVLILRTPMDAGPAKMRKRGAKPDVLKVGFFMNSTQIGTLDNFVKNTLKGTARFGFTHPRTEAIVECRILPSDDGLLYTANFLSADTYSVDMTFEVLP
jgi:hypothetical protein